MLKMSGDEQLETAGMSTMRSREQPCCILCGSAGQLLYEGVRDARFGVAGEWNVQRCSDPGCAMLWLSPMPIRDDIALAYRRYYTHQLVAPKSKVKRLYDAIRDAHNRSRYAYTTPKSTIGMTLLSALAYLHPGGPSELGRTVMYLPAFRGPARLLDVGCGSGDLLVQMQQLGWSVEGLDVDPLAVQVARSRGVPAHVGDLASRRYPEGQFDAVCMSHVLEHVHEPAELLLESHRILRAGGRLSLVTPNADSLGHQLFGRSWFALDPPRHLLIFNARTLEQMVKRAGFDLFHLTSTVYGARGIWLESRAIKKRGRAARGEKLGLVAHLGAVPFQLFERSMIKIGRNFGEELLLVATKN